MHVRLGWWGEEFRALLGKGAEIEAGSGKEILWLSDVHPVSLQVEGVQLSVGGHGWEGLLLDGCWAELNAVENGWVQDVDTGVNAVSDILDWLLNEAVDSGVVVWLVDNDTVLRWLVDLGDDNGTFVSVGLVESCKISKWVVADDIGVEDEEWLVILAQDLFCELERASRAKGLGLDGECDGDVELLLVLDWAESMTDSGCIARCNSYLCEVLLHNLWAVVHSQDDIGHTSSRKSLNLVENHALVAKLDQWLREGEGLPYVLELSVR